MASAVPTCQVEEYECVASVKHRSCFLTDEVIAAEDRRGVNIDIMSVGCAVRQFTEPLRFQPGSFAEPGRWKQVSVDNIAYFRWESFETRGLFLWKIHCVGRMSLVLTQQT